MTRKPTEDENLQQTGEILIFQGSDGRPAIQVRFEEQAVWLPQRLIADISSVSTYRK